ncbi:CHAT domain-containing protein [Mycena vulgaris]|nr:CHAT domain-containing protein [Mycena vulgaris]
MSRIIQLHNIRIRSTSNPHDDLPADMKIFAQLLIDGTIVHQTVPVDMEGPQGLLSWKLRFDCPVYGSPSFASTFRVAVMRKTRVNRLLGSVEISRGEALSSGEQKKPLRLPLVKVNLDGPLLELSAAFSVSTSSTIPSALDLTDIPGIHMGPVAILAIVHDLEGLCDAAKGQINVDSQLLLVMHERVLLLSPAEEIRGHLLGLLGQFWLIRWTQSRTIEELNQAVCAFEDAVRDLPTNTDGLRSLGNALLQRFQHLDDGTDINKCVIVFQNSARLTPDNHPDRPSVLKNLGGSLLVRFERLGNLDDFRNAVAMGQEAVTLAVDGDPDKPSIFNAYSTSLFTRFQRLGTIDDLNKAVSIQEGALRLTPQDHPDKPTWLSNLALFLLNDLAKSVAMQEDAVSRTPDDHPGKPSMLSHLGTFLLTRFEHMGEDIGDLTNSVSIHQDSVRLTQDGHPEKPSRLHNLSMAFLRRFERLGNLEDIDKSISIAEEAVGRSPEGHPIRAMTLDSLGITLVTRFKHSGNPNDLSKGLSMLQTAMDLTSKDHSSWPLRLEHLGSSLLTRFENFGGVSDINKCVAVLEEAIHLTPDGHIDKPGRIGNLGGALHARFRQFGDLADLNKSVLIQREAVRLTPESNPGDKAIISQNLANALHARFKRLGAVDDLNQSISMCESVVRLTPDGHPDRALRLNLLGKSLLALSEKTGDLKDLDRSISFCGDPCQLTPDSHPNKPTWLINMGNGLSCRFRRLNNLSDMNSCVSMRENAVRLTPDGHPDKPSWLYNLADTISLRFQRLHDLRDLDRMILNYSAAARSTTGPPHARFYAASRVAKPILNALAITTPSKEAAQRVWWCLTGPLTFLPIHAALIQGFRPQSNDQPELQLLAVAQPSATGQLYIPGTRKEINNLEQLAKSRKIPVMRLDENMATVESVQQGMKDSCWVHFASHGVQDRSEPTQSALLLAKSSRLTLAKIIQFSLPYADLTFLSACQNATGDKSLQEESVHLAAGMLLAGYRGVIATMWTIMDNDAPQVASDVYSHLFKTSPPDPTGVAEALHLAIRKLRKDSGGKKSFFHWVPFIHWRIPKLPLAKRDQRAKRGHVGWMSISLSRYLANFGLPDQTHSFSTKAPHNCTILYLVRKRIGGPIIL